MLFQDLDKFRSSLYLVFLFFVCNRSTVEVSDEGTSSLVPFLTATLNIFKNFTLTFLKQFSLFCLRPSWIAGSPLCPKSTVPCPFAPVIKNHLRPHQSFQDFAIKGQDNGFAYLTLIMDWFASSR